MDQLERRDAWDRWRNAGSVVSGLADTIHEIQRERGLSSGYLSGRGRQFSEELAYQVTRTNQAYERLNERLEDLGPSAWAPGTLSALGAAAGTFSAVDGIRLPVRLVEIDNDAAAAVQTAAIAVFLTAAGRVALGVGPEVTHRLTALHTLLTIKETLGRERALGAPVFARGGVKAEELAALHRLAAQRAEAVERFLALAPAEVAQRWGAAEQSAVVSERERFRALMTGSTLAAHGGPAAVYSWYEKSTAAIEELRAQSDAALEGFSLHCAERQKAEDEAWLNLLSGWGTAGVRLERWWHRALELREPSPPRPTEGDRETNVRAEIRRRRHQRRESVLALARDFQEATP
jgi:hypothetical protein